MAEFADRIKMLIAQPIENKTSAIQEIIRFAELAGYTVVDVDDTRPWGGLIRFDYTDGDAFIAEFFPEINPTEARLGNSDAEISPKFLLVAPGQRLSWQYHDRRTERWHFLNPGGYFRSMTDEPGEFCLAEAGEVVQFQAGERHRLCANVDSVSYTLVAEIWQHTDINNTSDEDDIIRLQDDYKR